MDLLQEIREAQQRSGVGRNNWGGRGCGRVFNTLSKEGQKAWREAGLPEYLLIVSDVRMIRSYARECGIAIPGRRRQSKRG